MVGSLGDIWWVKWVESCKIVFLGGHFLFTCSDTFAVGCIVYPQGTASQTDRQTDRQQYDASSRSNCMQQYDQQIKSAMLDVHSPHHYWTFFTIRRICEYDNEHSK